MRIVLGSRGSPLALWQAQCVADRLGDLGADVEIVVVKTEGDRDPEASLVDAGGRGVFVREIENALLAGAIDAAVHSLKDLPTATPPGLTLAGIPERGDPRDALVTRGGFGLEGLREGAVVGTGSPRRRSQLAHRRADLRFEEVRGNVGTRLAKLDAGRYDALVLACAGLTRLAVDRASWTPIDTEVSLPAPGQGAIAVECREDDTKTSRLIAHLDHAPTRAAVTAERAFLGALGAGCLAPAAALATVSGQRVDIDAMVATPDGRELRRDRATGPLAQASAVGLAVAEEILAGGGAAILAASR